MDLQNIPEGLYNIINDFIKDITNTFPEYNTLIKKFWELDYDDCYLNVEEQEKRKKLIDEDKEIKLKAIYNHCIRVFPERFFDILYENVEIFEIESDINTEFLPRISFKYLWNSDISNKTKETIWKYLQLILFTIISSVDNKDHMGDTAKMFEKINENDLKEKLEETLNNIQTIFENKTKDNKETTNEGINMENIPNAEDLNGHIKGMMNGKLGKIAMELAEETANDFNIDPSNMSNSGDIIKELFKNPGKLMNMVKNVGDKIDTKIKAGELSEKELMTEGLEMLNKMKSTGGMGDIQKMFSQMGIPGMGGKEKVNVSAMETKLKEQLKLSQMKEKIKKNSEVRKQKQEEDFKKKQQNILNNNAKEKLSDETLFKIFETGKKEEKSKRITTNLNSISQVESESENINTPLLISDKKENKDKKKQKNKK
jgi:hypothetical protein